MHQGHAVRRLLERQERLARCGRVEQDVLGKESLQRMRAAGGLVDAPGAEGLVEHDACRGRDEGLRPHAGIHVRDASLQGAVVDQVAFLDPDSRQGGVGRVHVDTAADRFDLQDPVGVPVRRVVVVAEGEQVLIDDALGQLRAVVREVYDHAVAAGDVELDSLLRNREVVPRGDRGHIRADVVVALRRLPEFLFGGQPAEEGDLGQADRVVHPVP